MVVSQRDDAATAAYHAPGLIRRSPVPARGQTNEDTTPHSVRSGMMTMIQPGRGRCAAWLCVPLDLVQAAGHTLADAVLQCRVAQFGIITIRGLNQLKSDKRTLCFKNAWLLLHVG